MSGLFDTCIVTLVSIHTPQVGLSKEEKNDFLDTVVHVVSGISERDVVVLVGDLMGMLKSQQTVMQLCMAG